MGSLTRRRSRLALVVVCLLAAGCTTTPEEQLREDFELKHGSETWYPAIDSIEVHGTSSIVISTKLDPLDPNVEELGDAICEAMAGTTPSDSEVSVSLKTLVPGSQAVDGSRDDPRVLEQSLAETISFPQDTCEAELYETVIRNHREGLNQLDG